MHGSMCNVCLYIYINMYTTELFDSLLFTFVKNQSYIFILQCTYIDYDAQICMFLCTHVHQCTMTNVCSRVDFGGLLQMAPGTGFFSRFCSKQNSLVQTHPRGICIFSGKSQLVKYDVFFDSPGLDIDEKLLTNMMSGK